MPSLESVLERDLRMRVMLGLSALSEPSAEKKAVFINAAKQTLRPGRRIIKQAFPDRKPRQNAAFQKNLRDFVQIMQDLEELGNLPNNRQEEARKLAKDILSTIEGK